MSKQLTLNGSNLRSILDGMVEGVIIINDRGIILSFNKSAETIFGYKTDEVFGQNVSMLMPDPDRKNHDKYLKRFVTTGDAHIIGIGRDVIAMRKNGEKFPLHLSISEYPAKIEGERWFIGSCLDITLHKKQEEQIKRSMKMEALGKLTGGIAHDYNNMLGVILGYSELLATKLKDSPELLEYLGQIKHAGDRGTSLTRKLLSFSRTQPDSVETVIINDVLRDDYKMLAKTLTAYIALNMKLDDDLWPVQINKGCFEDAILNMSINAMHAMPEGGSLEFSTSNVQVNTLDAQVLNINKGDYVKLSVSDTGIGMNDEILSHIFEPFFTTKDENGTGLGLSQVYGFVNSSGGTIRVYSEPGHGTCFSIYLPRYHSQSNSAQSDEPDELLGQVKYSGTGSILVVDDESAIRKLSEEILSSHGYNIICASGGKQALSILEQEDIDLVLSDVIMPEMDGYELAHLMLHNHPNVKILLCSGFAEDRGKTVTNDNLYKNALHKPFTSKELLHKVKELLKEK